MLLSGEVTLYPLLARLRKQGLLETTWAESTAGPPRRSKGTPICTTHPQVGAHLDDLARMLADIDPGERDDVLASVREHLDAEISSGAGTDAVVHAALLRLGPPERVTAEARAVMPLARRPARLVTLAILMVGHEISTRTTFVVAALGPAASVVMLAAARVDPTSTIANPGSGGLMCIGALVAGLVWNVVTLRRAWRETTDA